MVNYQQGKIYKLIDNTNKKIYVGSTCERTLAKRLSNHIAAYRFYLKNKNHFLTSFEILQNGDYKIVLIENYPCHSKEELKARERHYIEKLDCINKNIPLQTDQEYREAHKDEKQEYNRNYYKDNKGTGVVRHVVNYFETLKNAKK